MEQWHIGVNGYFGSASVHREVAPWWNFAAEKFIWWFLVRVIPDVKFPKWWTSRLGTWDTSDDQSREWSTCAWGDWYGDSLRHRTSWLATDLHARLWRRRKVVHFDVPMRRVMDAFGDAAPKFWAESWDRGTEMRREQLPDATRGVDYRADEQRAAAMN